MATRRNNRPDDGGWQHRRTRGAHTTGNTGRFRDDLMALAIDALAVAASVLVLSQLA
ncbi:hypothetical protein SAMN04489712_112123 [Thermomonospora echinospora]|uniref:RDD family protein n=1 Tax=Thermomonospora echinospora TaxID=1992 RepID=A0A1H6D0G8_9ACTN|nr:hypothetical protein SAMN04489712_112123 [Thermomonospora echinospora]